MANGDSSPFATSHDTLGMSFLHTPRFMQSSPPKLSPYNRPGIQHGSATRRMKTGTRRSSKSPRSSDGDDSEANLSDYTFDLNNLPDARASTEKKDDGIANKAASKDNDSLSEHGGPDDFTLNMVQMLKGGNMEDDKDNPLENSKADVDIDGPPTRQAHDETSEIEPPLEMSTPAHVLSRRNDFTHHETQQKQQNNEFALELERLRKELRKKDEIISANQRRVLDAASIVQQVRHLQAELEKENKKRLAESASTDKQIRELETQIRVKDEELKFKNQNGDEEACSLLREQLQAKEKLLQQTKAKLDETIASSQRELSDMAAENDQLRSEHHENVCELDKLDSDIESLTTERDMLQTRNQHLDKRVKHLESELTKLQQSLSMEKSETASNFDALKNVANNLSLAIDGKSFKQVLDIVMRTYQSRRDEDASRAQITTSETENKENGATNTQAQLQEAKMLNQFLSLQLEEAREDLLKTDNALDTIQEKYSSALDAGNAQMLKLCRALEKASLQHAEAVETVKHISENVIQTPLNPETSPPPSLAEVENRFEMKDSPKSHREEIDQMEDSHALKISKLRDSHAQSTRTLHALLGAAQDRERELQSELVEVRKLLSSNTKEISALETERERLESVIEAKDAAAAALDSKFAAVLKKREEVWGSRIEKLLHDRERMGKALMWTWGEMEVGKANQREDTRGTTTAARHTQGYRYKHVARMKGTG
ncbi:predicted protein [Uncinocarpus reesii 1704]|uniref:Spindle pole body associated protein SnaD n=1 Tax=Uncinocarpus reesii (strain UAMH 1704) TaxID=336963 RepID=C4JLZ3_UNCRE|nr:uncharacterized protein UREG_03851 [Uncinocarpus reesii 1704]EEP79005.1 predicted protein [Uncinocarpus reesii 1704]